MAAESPKQVCAGSAAATRRTRTRAPTLRSRASSIAATRPEQIAENVAAAELLRRLDRTEFDALARIGA
jgi:hypothetical protein